MTNSSAFDRCNRTELYQLCVRAEIPVRPNETREAMIAYLNGEKEPVLQDEKDHAIHSWRHGIIRFVDEYWKQIETQLDCPVRKLRDPNNPDPRPCFGCLDTQVIACIVDNEENEPLIEARKKE
jgi:hypothetical protein